MHYADAVGLDEVYRRVLEFKARLDAENWSAAPLLEQLAVAKTSLADWARDRS